MNWLWFSLAWISFSLGIIGAFLPVIPTTPFLILAAFLFSRSSPKFHAWLMSLPIAGKAVRDWQDGHVIRPRAKFFCVVMIAFSLVMIWVQAPVHVLFKAFLTLLLVSVATFVVTRKSHLG